MNDKVILKSSGVRGGGIRDILKYGDEQHELIKLPKVVRRFFIPYVFKNLSLPLNTI